MKTIIRDIERLATDDFFPEKPMPIKKAADLLGVTKGYLYNKIMGGALNGAYDSKNYGGHRDLCVCLRELSLLPRYKIMCRMQEEEKLCRVSPASKTKEPILGSRMEAIYFFSYFFFYSNIGAELKKRINKIHRWVVFRKNLMRRNISVEEAMKFCHEVKYEISAAFSRNSMTKRDEKISEKDKETTIKGNDKDKLDFIVSGMSLFIDEVYPILPNRRYDNLRL